ncbi:sensor histidine kinase [Jiulongibacter sp. NS-SX5]|uniref:sensor histidine kinase n=1 Tax=Jiulongibacter sp. NS-SX5 TaxID=3463854 RepID=UPI004058DC45
MKTLTGVLVLLFLTACRLQAQVPALEVCEHCLSEQYPDLFSSDQLPDQKYRDSLSFELVYNSEKVEKALLFVSDAHYISVNNLLFGGTYQHDSLLQKRENRFLLPVHIEEGDNRFIIRLKNRNDEVFFVKPILFLGDSTEEITPLMMTQNERARNIHYAVFAILCVILVYAVFQFFMLKKGSFRTYAWYVGSIIIFLLFFADNFFNVHWLTRGDPWVYTCLNLIPQGLIYVLYAEFGMDFLEARQKDKTLNTAKNIFNVLTMSVVMLNAFFLLSSTAKQFFDQYFYLLYFLPLAVSTYMAVRIILKIKDQTKWFIILGSVLITAGTFIEIFGVYVYDRPKPRSFYFIPSSGVMDFNYVEMGYVLESLIFLLAIAYKNSRTERNVQKLNEHTILQLQEKERLEKQVNDLLNEKLKQSEDKLAGQRLLNENERNKTRLMQAQLKSLQLQMNPHYLFNSLNSINDFIISKEPQQASEYLALYARMMRNTLRNSDQAFNTLEQELQYSEDYLKLEALRFDTRFTYEIIRPRDLSLLDFDIPGMMLQPVLENAVWHGMLHLDYPGKITLEAKSNISDALEIIIIDNGHGLPEQAKTKGYGLKNIHEKIELLSQLYKKRIHFKVGNRAEGNGVEVRFEIPKFDQ